MRITMNLPRNYVEIEEEEMMYLDGGWSPNQVIKNCIGLAAVAGLNYVAKTIRNFVKVNKGLGFWKTSAKLAVIAAKAFWALPFWAKFCFAAGGTAVVYALGTWDIF